MRPFLARIVEALHHRAGREAHDPVRNPDRNDLRQRRAAEKVDEAGPIRRGAVELVPGEQAQGAGAVSAIAESGACRCPVGGVVTGAVILREVALEVLPQIVRQRDVLGIEARIEMGDDDLFELVADRAACRRQFAEMIAEVPRNARTSRSAPAACLRIECAKLRFVGRKRKCVGIDR